jgi:hypothetical protein
VYDEAPAWSGHGVSSLSQLQFRRYGIVEEIQPNEGFVIMSELIHSRGMLCIITDSEGIA